MKNHERNPAYLVFTLSLILAATSAILLFSECWEDYATARYWRRLSEQADILPRFRSLYEQNPDIVGWLRVDDTAIDYPVMQRKDDPEYYLYRKFDGQASQSGAPFADYRCQVTPAQGFNTVIYLHDRLMLELNQYTYLPNYLESHRRVRFDTLTQEGVYEVVAAFYADADGARLLDPWNPDDPQAYEFYNYLEADSLAGFRKYAEGVRERQILKTDADFSPRSHLLTLVCCATERFSGIRNAAGRLVVIAKRVGT